MLGLCLALTSSTAPIACGQTAYPMLMSIDPVAVQVGTTSEVTVRSRYDLSGAYQVAITGEGVQGEVVAPKTTDKPAADKSKPVTLETLTLKITVDAQAVSGVRDLRVATPRGVSTVGQLVITQSPVTYEQKDNDNLLTSQEVKLPVTLCGRIEKAEDVDTFHFEARADQTLVFHMQCMQLEDRIHDLQQHADPILVLRDSHGSTIAASDNELRGDPLIVHKFARDGIYKLELRDVRYEGNANWVYSVEISEQPFVTHVFPIGVAQNARTNVELIGYHVPNKTEMEIDAPASQITCVRPIVLDGKRLGAGQTWKTEVGVVLSRNKISQELGSSNDTPGAAQDLTADMPCGVNGRCEKEGDVDCFAFQAKKGEAYQFEVFARRAGSTLDSHLRLLDEKGNQLSLSDDTRFGKRNTSDSLIENWSAPADGRYILEVRDLHLRGGGPFVYFLNVTRSEPYFALYADTDKTLLTPGTTGVLYVRADRKNGFDQEIELGVEGLPEGVKADCGRILTGKSLDGCIVFSVDGKAVPQIANIQIVGRAISKDSAPTSKTTAVVYQEIYQPGGGRGHWPVENHVLSIDAPSDITRVQTNAQEIVLKPGQSKELEVNIERAAGFDKNVILEVTFTHLAQVFGSSLPDGITVDANASTTLLTGGATKGKIVLKAASDAKPVARQQFAVMANVSLNFVMKATYGSAPVYITIEP